MYKLLQIEQVIGCFYELCITSKNFKFFQWLEAVCPFWIGRILLFIILTFSIYIGDTKIPTYLGDGYRYDNFKRKEGDGPEYNYWLDCHIGNDAVILQKNT